jgi:hypothetical protein
MEQAMKMAGILISALLYFQTAAVPVIRDGIRGKVFDANLLQLPGVTVTLLNTKTNQTTKATTPIGGEYYFDCVEDGNYDLTFELNGFLTQSQKGIRYLYPGEKVVDAMMSIGHVGQGEGPFLILHVFDSKTQKSLESATIQRNGKDIAKTDACGRSWDLLGSGEYEFTIAKPGYKTQQLKVKAGTQRISLEVHLDKIV